MEYFLNIVRKFFMFALPLLASNVYAQVYTIGWHKSGEPESTCAFWDMTQLQVCQIYGYDNINYYGKCSHGDGSGGMVLNQCIMKHVLIVPIESSPKPLSCSGNPIDNVSGAKIQHETDVSSVGVGGVYYARTYNNADKTQGGRWYHNYDKHLSVLDDTNGGGIKVSGTAQEKKSSACGAWSAIKDNLSEGWAQGATSRWNDAAQLCEIIKNNVVVKQLPVVPELPVWRSQKPSYIQLFRGDGSILNFYKKSASTYLQGDGSGGVLKLTNPNPLRWELALPSGSVEIYEGNRLVELVASNGVKQELHYDSVTGFLVNVKDSHNRELVFTYNGNNVSSVTVDGNKTTKYTYNSLGLISSAIYPNGATRIYHYEDARFPTALTGITDERNKRFASWIYDDLGRAISSEHAGGAEKTLLNFNEDQSTTVTNSLGKKTTYFYSFVAGMLRVIKVEGESTSSCVGANKNYSFTTEGWLASKTDWRGVKTTYQYNSLGQEVSRTEAAGTLQSRTILTQWHPSLYLITKITEPRKETSYTYDSEGHLISTTVTSLEN